MVLLDLEHRDMRSLVTSSSSTEGFKAHVIAGLRESKRIQRSRALEGNFGCAISRD